MTAPKIGSDAVVEHFTLDVEQHEALRNKTGNTLVGFALTWCYLLWRGRFPRSRQDIPADAIAHVAVQVGLPGTDLDGYDLTGRQASNHRAEIRRLTGFHPCTVTDADKLAGWVATGPALTERRAEPVRALLLQQHCLNERIEPPTLPRVARIVDSGFRQVEHAQVALVASRMRPAHVARLNQMVGLGPEPGEGDNGGDGKTTYYPTGEHIVTDGVVCPDWAEFALATDTRGRTRVVRQVYECCVLIALRERLRCKEIWVAGADAWRNPDEDLPADFEDHRAQHYQQLSLPREARAFTASLQTEMRAELDALQQVLPACPWLRIESHRLAGPIRLTRLERQPEPQNLRRLKAAIRDRWGTVPLIDVLKEAALRTGMLNALTPAGRGNIAEEILFERLLLCIYAYGTNSGLRTVAAGEHGHTEADLRYVARRYLTPAGLKAVAVAIADATFAARQQAVWGEGTTTLASDSTHFSAYDRNVFTEWHSRYGGRGVLVYWSVEAGAMAIHSQLISCTASEVAAMIEGVMRHGSTMRVPAPRVRPAPADQADQPRQALPPRRRRRPPVARARARHDQRTGGGVLQLVRFINDQQRVRAERIQVVQVREQQGVVGYQQPVCGQRLPDGVSM
ncbi:MAG TPA: Tn3 family transposase [Streptosporangiaceae bacterium]|nr:Tn3 family transposase [Streptosporangiaceae bacterium]